MRKYEETTESKIFEEEEDTNKDWERLKGTVKEAMESKRVVEKRWKIGQKYWWNRECTREKRKVNRWYKKYRQGKIEKEEYLKKKKDFRILCENKEKCKKQEEQAETGKAKIEKEIWDYINKERKEKKSNENRNMERPF